MNPLLLTELVKMSKISKFLVFLFLLNVYLPTPLNTQNTQEHERDTMVIYKIEITFCTFLLQQAKDFLSAAESLERLLTEYIKAYEPQMAPTAAQQNDMVLRIFKRRNAREFRKSVKLIANV